MIIHGRLQWALAIGVLAFSFAAVVASIMGGGDASSAATTTTTSSVATTTTTTIAVPLKHVVKSGESLFSIAQLYSVKMEAIIELNKLDNPDKLGLGDEILLPQGSVARVAPVTSTSVTSAALVTTSAP
ncbi:MAG: LysM domain [Actinomycetota bacterium]|jgi:LysM repeat protein